MRTAIAKTALAFKQTPSVKRAKAPRPQPSSDCGRSLFAPSATNKTIRSFSSLLPSSTTTPTLTSHAWTTEHEQQQDVTKNHPQDSQQRDYGHYDHGDHHHDYSSSFESTLDNVMEMIQLGKETSSHWEDVVRSAYTAQSSYFENELEPQANQERRPAGSSADPDADYYSL